MKILFLMNNLDIKWGRGRFNFNVISRLIKKGYNCTALTIPDEEKIGKSQISTYEILRNNYNLLTFLVTVLKIRRLVKKHDLIHALDGYPFAVFAYLANLGLKKKFFITAIGTYAIKPLQKNPKAFLLKMAYRKANKIFCISNYVKSRISYYLPELKNLTTVHMGADMPIHPECLRKKAKNNPIILSVGALKNRKGQHLSILALIKLKKFFPGITLRIIGNQENKKYYGYLKKLASDNKVEDNVIFKKNISDEELESEYKNADLFLMPSLSVNDTTEGFGLVYLEAAAFGLPCIGSRDTGSEDAILDGQNGYLVEQNDDETIAEKIIKILSDHSIYQQFSEKSIWWAKQFSWDKTVNEYVNFYEQ